MLTGGGGSRNFLGGGGSRNFIGGGRWTNFLGGAHWTSIPTTTLQWQGTSCHHPYHPPSNLHLTAHSKQRQKEKDTHRLFTNAGTTRGIRGRSRQFPRGAVERRRARALQPPAPPPSVAPPRAAAQPSPEPSRAAGERRPAQRRRTSKPRPVPRRRTTGAAERRPTPAPSWLPSAVAAAERRRPCQALSPRAVGLAWPCVLRRPHRAVPDLGEDQCEVQWQELRSGYLELNVVKHLSPVKGEDKVEGEDDEPHILSDFSACMFGFEDKTTFQEAFDDMRCKVHKQTWLDSIYKLREKWAECYMRDVFSLGVRSTQLSESFNNALKIHLKSDFHIVRFLKHFERAVEVKRSKELQSEFEARKNIPRVKINTLMLVEASKVYTRVIFEAFQGEYERSMGACSKALDGNNIYVVSIGRLDGTFEEERIVTGDPLTQTVSCTCGIFNRVGIMCAHGLKVLDLMNIKILPAHYVLKRWTRDAQKGIILDRQGRNVVADPQLEVSLRVKNLSYKFLTLAKKIANSEECCLMLEDAIESIGPKLEDKLNASASATNEPSKETSKEQENIDPNVQQTANFLNAAQLKKKEVQSKNIKRTRTFMEKLRKGKRKPTKFAPSTTKGAKQPKKDDVVQPQVEVQNDGNKKEAHVLHEEYNVIGSFTQLLSAPTCDDDSLYDENIF
nr:protein FAR1-RELATED SEQUENCE 5-like [Lolium perenne]